MRQISIAKNLALVGQIGQGTFRFGGLFKADNSQDDKAIHALRHGIDCGMNLIDTAENYGDGHCEEIVGKAVKTVREQVVIASKFAPQNSGAKELRKALDGTLRRLGIDTIDIYQMHWPNYEVPFEETLHTLDELAQLGKLKAIGLGNCTISELNKISKIAIKTPVVSLQNEYSPIERSVESKVLPALAEAKMALLAYSPLAQGKVILGQKKSGLEEMASKYDIAIPSLLLNWLCRYKNVIPIPQTFNPDHVLQNSQSLDMDLELEDMLALEQLFEECVEDIAVNKIAVNNDSSPKAYMTLDAAMNNELNWTPSPLELSKNYLNNDLLKPVKVRKVEQAGNCQFAYELVEGRVKYWAWVIAHQGDKPIPAIIEN
ncbi:MAG: aryl-alcohol dehydrogenase-like predicted oxidoreductase [Candidatus Omnitrophota bacterium]|jgi:aryl-alcohol dehydrogenase-like predicted oxidoreductase